MESGESKARKERDFRDLNEKAEREARNSHGSSRFMLYPDDPAWKHLLNPDTEFLCGRTDDGRIIRAGGGHITIFAPTGSGKGTAIILPNLIHAPNSVLVIDTKGEAAAVTAQHRARMGQSVFILDPYDLPGSRHKNNRFLTSFDPFQWISPDSPTLLEDLHMVSCLFVIDESGDGKNGFFSDEARSAATAISLYMFTRPSEERTFETFIDLIYMPLSDMKEVLIPLMRRSDAFGGALKMLANTLEGYTADMLKNVFSTIKRSLNVFVLSPQLRKAMRPSNLDLRQLKDRPMTLYVCLPPDMLKSHGRWLRLVTGIALRQNTDDRRPRHDLLIMADELASLGRMEQLEDGISILRGFGIRLLSIYQDTNQIAGLYPKSWQTWIANSALNAAFNANDNHTSEYVSKKLGVTTVRTHTDQLDRERLHGGSTGWAGRPLLTPDEVERMGADRLLLMFAGKDPILANKLHYWKEREFFYPDGSPMFDENPYYKG